MGYIEKTDKTKETKLKLKNNINDLGSDITSSTPFRDYVDKLTNIYNALPKVTGTGTEVTLENTKSGKMVIQPKGNTSQYSYSGKNLFNKSNADVVDGFVYSGGTLRSGSIWKSIIFAVSASTTYAISKSKGNTLRVASFENYPQLGDSYISGSGQLKDSDNSIVYTTSSNATYIAVTIYGSATTTDTLQDVLDTLQIEQNSSTTSYEPYTGGIASPNPSYPQDIKVVTGDNNVKIRGKNLFDFNTWLNFQSTRIIYGTYVSSDSNSITISSTKDDCYTYYSDTSLNIKAKGNTAYTLQCVKELIEGTNIVGSAYLFEYDNNGNLFKYTSLGNDTVLNFTTQSKTKNIRIRLGILFANNTVKFSNIMLLEGTYTSSTIPDYEPYIEPIEKELKLKGKNLFDGELEIGGINTSTGENQSNILNAYARTKNYIEVNSNTTYSFQYVRVDGGSAQIVIYEYDSNKNYIQFSAKNTNSDLLTLSNTTKYVRVRYAGEDNSTLNSYSNIQIEQGSATSYEPYYNYNLMKDDYITEDCVIHHKRNKVVFNGTENWNLQSINSNGIANFYLGLNDYSGRDENIAVSNYFKAQSTPIGSTTSEGFYLVSAKTLYIRLESSKASTVADFKTWLSTHNTIVEYELAEETTEIIPNTIPLYNQVKDLYRTIIPGGTIIVETESDEENAQLIVNASALEKI